MTAPGTVYLVGAGPGDPELLTVKARRLLREADLVLHDALVGDAIVESLPEEGTVDVGKRPDGERTPQATIDRLMIEAAREGKTVVRLKGGDPTVFGRGGEELAALAAADVPVSVVPGITSAVAAPGVAGIPLTHREHASSVTVITGHEDPSKPGTALDWAALADNVTAGGTLVILMGVGRLADNVAALERNDVAADTPVAMVERATLPGEVVVTATLDTIVERAREADVSPPATTVVGDVAAVREEAADLLATADARRLGSDTGRHGADAGRHGADDGTTTAGPGAARTDGGGDVTTPGRRPSPGEAGPESRGPGPGVGRGEAWYR